MCDMVANSRLAPSNMGIAATAASRTRCTSSRCRRPGPGLNDGVRLCRSCKDWVRRDLAEMPGLYRECEELLVTAPSRELRERISGRRVRTMPFNTAVATVRSEILGTLASWSGLVVSERRIASRPRRTAADLSSFLVRHLDWLAAHPAAGDFAHEVRTTASTARMSTKPAPSTLIELGPCTQPGCDQVIHASVQQSGDRTVHQVGCAAGHQWETHQWLLLAHQLRQLQTASPSGHTGAAS